MSEEEFNERRAGKTEDEFQVENSTAQNFILGRSKELINVPISSGDKKYNIEIRARLTKKEVKNHRDFLQMFQNPEKADEELADELAANFLADITTDKSLDKEFWMRDDIDSSIMQELLTAFIEKAVSTVKGVKKFRR